MRARINEQKNSGADVHRQGKKIRGNHPTPVYVQGLSSHFAVALVYISIKRNVYDKKLYARCEHS